MINIEEIYQEYLNHLRVKNKEKYKDHKGWFSASSAGSCYRKMMYRTMDIDTPAPDVRSNRLLRLGTILHDDFEKSIDLYTLIITNKKKKSPLIIGVQRRGRVLADN